MKIYLASRYSRRGELKKIASTLRSMGHVVTSRWLETEWVNRPSESSAAPPEYREKYAIIDLEDVKESECVISFTDPPNSSGRGGRHVEFGYAYGLGKKLIVVGYRENLFHHLPEVDFFETVEQMLCTLDSIKR